MLFLSHLRRGNARVSFIDSTVLRVCHNKRIKRNKVFKDVAHVGKSTMGWFFGFKQHLIINDKGEILSFYLTKDNVDDRNIKVLTRSSRRPLDLCITAKSMVTIRSQVRSFFTAKSALLSLNALLKSFRLINANSCPRTGVPAVALILNM